MKKRLIINLILFALFCAVLVLFCATPLVAALAWVFGRGVWIPA